MFPDGLKEPYERTRKLIQKLAPALKAMPYRISIVGHTSTSHAAAQAGLRAVGTLRRPRQCGAPDPGGGRGAGRAYLHGGRQGRYRPSVSGRSLDVPESPGHHHPDAGSAAAAARFEAVITGTATEMRSAVAAAAGNHCSCRSLKQGSAARDPGQSGLRNARYSRRRPGDIRPAFRFRLGRRSWRTKYANAMSDVANQPAEAPAAASRSPRCGPCRERARSSPEFRGLGARQRRRRLRRHRHQPALRVPRSGARRQRRPSR